jgi:hypothetical protein
MAKKQKTPRTEMETAKAAKRLRRQCSRKPRTLTSAVDEGRLRKALEPLAKQKLDTIQFSWTGEHYGKAKATCGIDRVGLQLAAPVLEHMVEACPSCYPKLPGIRRVLQELDIQYKVMGDIGTRSRGDESTCMKAANLWENTIEPCLAVEI